MKHIWYTMEMSGSSYSLSTPVSKGLAVAAVVFMFVGLMTFKPLSFSDLAAALLIAGCSCAMLSILLHLHISKKSTAHEKALALAASMSVIFLTSAIITFSVVKVDFRLQDGQKEDQAVVMFPGRGGGPYEDTSSRAVILIATHVYATYAACLLLFALMLFILSAYIKKEFL